MILVRVQSHCSHLGPNEISDFDQLCVSFSCNFPTRGEQFIFFLFSDNIPLISLL